MTDISLQGMDQLLKDLTSLAGVMDDKEMEDRLLDRARELRDKIKQVTPKGPTGNLKKAVVAKRFRRKIIGNPGTYVKMNRKKAPHFHLVEYGTEGIRFPKGKVLHFQVDGQDVFVKNVGPMPARPFFRPTVDNEKENVQRGIAEDAAKVIENAVNKSGTIVMGR